MDAPQDDNFLSLLNGTIFTIKFSINDIESLDITYDELLCDTFNCIDRLMFSVLKTDDIIWNTLELNSNIVGEIEEYPEDFIVEFMFQFRNKSAFNKFKLLSPEFYKKHIEPRITMMRFWSNGAIEEE